MDGDRHVLVAEHHLAFPLSHVAGTIFTEPEIATVGITHQAVEAGEADAAVVKLPLDTNARAKMQGFGDGFIELFAAAAAGSCSAAWWWRRGPASSFWRFHWRSSSCSPWIRWHTFAVYPSLSGSVTEAARTLMQPAEGVRGKG